MHWANGSGSDLIVLLNVYKAWESQFGARAGGREHRKRSNEYEWADKFNVDIDAIHECRSHIVDIKERFERYYMMAKHSGDQTAISEHDKETLLKLVIAGAFYPNYFGQSTKENHFINAYKSFGCRDPRKTVYFTGFPAHEHVRSIYTESIKNIFIQNGVIHRSDADNVRVSFDSHSNKVFVTFDEGADREKLLMPTNISTEVYKSLRMKKTHPIFVLE